jgi:hypothetical protein
MATALTRFEIILPVIGVDQPGQRAVSDFLTSMRTLCDVVSYSATIRRMDTSITEQTVIYGLLTNAQLGTASGFLTTLNTALGSNVLCTIMPVTQEP